MNLSNIINQHDLLPLDIIDRHEPALTIGETIN